MKKPKSNEYGVSVRIKAPTHKQMKAYCKRKGIVAFHFASQAIEEKLKRVNDTDAD